MLILKENGKIRLISKSKLIEITKRFDTPFFLIDSSVLEKKITEFKCLFSRSKFNYKLYYSVKTNYTPFILKFLNKMNVGLEVISGFEVDILDELGLLSPEVIINGPSKSYKELKKIIQAGAIIQLDSLEELKCIKEIADNLKKKVRVGLRIQPLNSNWKRFGISTDEIKKFLNEVQKYKNHITLVGLHCHIGTQILDPSLYKETAKQLENIVIDSEIYKTIKYLNLGGGLPSYMAPLTHHKNEPKPYSEYLKAIEEGLKTLHSLRSDIEILLEPGRAIVDESTDLVASVMSNENEKVVLDTGKNHIPSMNIRHHPVFFEKDSGPKVQEKGLFGCLCMRTDSFPTNIEFPDLKRNDRILIGCVGAYGQSQSMTFIKYKPPTYVFSSSDEKLRFNIISKRQTIKDILATYII